MSDSANRPASAGVNAAIGQLLERGGTAALATVVAGSSLVGAKLLVESTGETTGSLGSRELNNAVAQFGQQFLATRDQAHTYSVRDLAPPLTALAATRILFERIQPEPRIVIFGAGHVGAALAKLASFAGYHVTLIDDRAELVTRERFPEELIELVAAESWTKAAGDAIGKGRGVSVAIVTRGHAEDEECLRAVMDSTPDYIGLIGSKRRTNIVLERLRATGSDSNRLAKVRAPIGLDIGAVTPEEVAVAILAEIVAERRGGEGGSLSAWRRDRKGGTGELGKGGMGKGRPGHYEG
ncbi:MAG TPA: XdhC/CoxI family protein [Pyrinomonadaceae bacterium]|nr:XdhC/CoxI family protein [Pyrinomonadaceae bacterium]